MNEFSLIKNINMITISVNNKDHQIEAAKSLQEILEELEVTVNGVAVAINQSIITKSEWSNTQLIDKDEVLIIKATQGG